MMTLRGYEALLLEYEEYRWHKALMLYVPPLLVVLGSLGNLLTVLILCCRCMRKNSTYVYLAVLAVADTVVLYVGLLRLWLGELMGQDVRDFADWLCKAVNVLGHAASDYSVWLIIAVTVERYIVVCHPLKVVNICQGRRALGVVGILALIFLALNLHFIWTVQVINFPVDGGLVPQCAGGDDYRYMIENVWPWVDAFVYSFIPFLIIVFLNILIIRQVILAKRLRFNMTYEQSIQCRGKPGNKKDRRSSSTSHESSRLTVMLLCISFTFLVTTLPMNLTLIPITFGKTDKDSDIRHLLRLRLVRTITELLMYLNHSINFYLYCATGRKFRQQLCRLLGSRCRIRAPNATPEPSPWRLSFSTGNQQALMIRLREMDGLPGKDGTAFL